MRRIILFFSLMFVICGAVMAQQMTDDQIIQYVKSANQAGKSQQQIAAELMRRGVTREQLEQIYEDVQGGGYENQQGNKQSASRERTRSTEDSRRKSNADEKDKKGDKRPAGKKKRIISGNRMQTNLDEKNCIGKKKRRKILRNRFLVTISFPMRTCRLNRVSMWLPLLIIS